MATGAENVGDWSYQAGDAFYAATVNDSGGIFGQWCDGPSQTCVYLIGTTTACETDASYPVLVNSDSGSSSMTIICRGKLDGQSFYRFAFSNFDQMDITVRSAKRIGIAMPLRDDQFKVSRFSLEGAKTSIDIMREAVQQASTRRQRSGTRDQRL